MTLWPFSGQCPSLLPFPLQKNTLTVKNTQSGLFNASGLEHGEEVGIADWAGAQLSSTSLNRQETKSMANFLLTISIVIVGYTFTVHTDLRNRKVVDKSFATLRPAYSAELSQNCCCPSMITSHLDSFFKQMCLKLLFVRW